MNLDRVLLLASIPLGGLGIMPTKLSDGASLGACVLASTCIAAACYLRIHREQSI